MIMMLSNFELGMQWINDDSVIAGSPSAESNID